MKVHTGFRCTPLRMMRDQRNLLLEILVCIDMVCRAFERKSWVLSAVVAWRKVLTYNGSNFMLLAMFHVVYDPVNSGLRNFISRFILGSHGDTSWRRGISPIAIQWQPP
jgi:hypothetical protein